MLGEDQIHLVDEIRPFEAQVPIAILEPAQVQIGVLGLGLPLLPCLTDHGVGAWGESFEVESSSVLGGNGRACAFRGNPEMARGLGIEGKTRETNDSRADARRYAVGASVSPVLVLPGMDASSH